MIEGGLQMQQSNTNMPNGLQEFFHMTKGSLVPCPWKESNGHIMDYLWDSDYDSIREFLQSISPEKIDKNCYSLVRSEDQIIIQSGIATKNRLGLFITSTDAIPNLVFQVQ